MRTEVGTYATIHYPEQYIYSEDVCNVFCDATDATVTRFVINLNYVTASPATTDIADKAVTLTPDANGNTFVDISPYNRSMVWECGKTLARLTLTIQVVVYAGDTVLETISKICTLEPGTGRLTFTSLTVGEAVQPPKEVQVFSLENVGLLIDLQYAAGAGKLQVCTAGVWSDVATLNPQTGVDNFLKPYVTAYITYAYANKPLRVLNYTGVVVWQGRANYVGEACSYDKWAWVEWRADQWLNKKSWCFKIKSISRKVTESQDLALQPFVYQTSAYYNTQGVNERNGQGFNRQKNWQLQMQVAVDGLTEREMMYFNDLFTSPEVSVKTAALLETVIWGKLAAAVDGNSLQTTFKAERGSMTLTLLIADFKQY